MKRQILLFISIFIGCLLVVYLYPTLTYQRLSETTINRPRSQQPPSTSLNTEVVPASGLALYIGQDIDAFEKEYGIAEQVTDSGFGFKNHIYQYKDTSFFEVTTMSGQITSVKFIGHDQIESTPFQIGMTISDVLKDYVISPNVQFEYNHEKYSFELMEDDMNYRPLIAFDNGTFAILFFDQQKNNTTLYAMMYLDAQTLLKLAPFNLTEGAPLFFSVNEEANWVSINAQKSEKSHRLMQILRKEFDFPVYENQPSLQYTTEEQLTKFLENPEEIISTERLKSYLRIQENEEQQRWVLNNQELAVLLKDYDPKIFYGHFEMPVYDPIFTILSWYSNPYLVSHLFYEKSEAIGIAFSKENMLVLFQEVNKTMESGDNH